MPVQAIPPRDVRPALKNAKQTERSDLKNQSNIEKQLDTLASEQRCSCQTFSWEIAFLSCSVLDGDRAIAS